jgi:flagellar hook-associated protein 1 FlgK
MTTDLNNVISVKVNDINSIVKQISDVNGQIARIVPNNYQPNDLYDKRDLLVDQLSKLVNVDVKPSDNGMIDVFVSGQAIVKGQTGNPMTYSQDPTSKQFTVNIGQNQVNIQSGELLGRMEAVSKIIPDIQNSINQLASAFATQVNDIHKQGLNMDDIANPANQPTVTTTDQLDFFTQDSNGSWVVNPVIMNSSLGLNKIAAASKMSVGDGTNALAIGSVKTSKLDALGSTADDFYRNVIGQLGVDSQQSQRMQDNSQSIVDQVDNRRQSVSGVSLDEEMSNMIKYQQSYNAAARLVNVMDEVLDKVINGMGR